MDATATLGEGRPAVCGAPLEELDLAPADVRSFATRRVNGAAISLTTKHGGRQDLVCPDTGAWKGLAELAKALEELLPEGRSRSILGSQGMLAFCWIATLVIVGAVAHAVTVAGVRSWGGLRMALALVPVLWNVYLGSK